MVQCFFILNATMWDSRGPTIKVKIKFIDAIPEKNALSLVPSFNCLDKQNIKCLHVCINFKLIERVTMYKTKICHVKQFDAPFCKSSTRIFWKKKFSSV